MTVPCRLRNSAQRALLARLLVLAFLLPIAAVSQPPSLIVLIVAEQFRGDYLDLYRPQFGEGGFERMLTQGAVYRRSRYDHLTTLASPNAATLATGAYPQIHGIVADRWFDADSRRTIGSADEGAVQQGGDASGISPRFLKGSTFADELRMATSGGSRVVAISDRPGPAVMLAGRSPLGCYWMSGDGHFETSAYYRNALPAWVEEFNAAHGAAQYKDEAWTALRAPGPLVPLRILHAPDPLALEGFHRLYHASPFAAADAFAFAQQALEAERLGQGTYTDLLIINLSAPALLGLETGAHSPLMRDLVLRLDQMLGAFLSELDSRFPNGESAVVFTAAHGLPLLAEDARALGLPAGRVSGATVVAAMNQALAEKFGPEIFVEKYVYPFAYLGREARQRSGEARNAIIEEAGKAARRLAGVAGFYSPWTDDVAPAVRERLRRSWHEPRSGDFMLLYEPYFVEDYGEDRGTAPGSLYRYDTDVPLIFLGQHFKAARFEAVVDAASVASTLSALAGVPAPSSATGSALAEALAAPDRAEAPSAKPAVASSAR